MWSGPMLLLMSWMIKPWKAFAKTMIRDCDKDNPDFRKLQWNGPFWLDQTTPFKQLQNHKVERSASKLKYLRDWMWRRSLRSHDAFCRSFWFRGTKNRPGSSRTFMNKGLRRWGFTLLSPYAATNSYSVFEMSFPWRSLGAAACVAACFCLKLSLQLHL